MADDPAEAPASTSPPTPASSLADTIAAAIRNGLSNGPIAQSPLTWAHLDTRLGEIVAAILKEI